MKTIDIIWIIIIIAIMAFIIGTMCAAHAVDSDTMSEIITAAKGAAERYDIPVELILAVIETESTYRPDAKNGSCRGAIISIALRQRAVIASQSPASMLCLGKSFEPIPTTVTPALNHAVRFSSVGSTAPVAIIIDHGIGAFTFFTNDGPPTSPAGNIFTKSHPAACAVLISVTLPQPGV